MENRKIVRRHLVHIPTRTFIEALRFVSVNETCGLQRLHLSAQTYLSVAKDERREKRMKSENAVLSSWQYVMLESWFEAERSECLWRSCVVIFRANPNFPSLFSLSPSLRTFVLLWPRCVRPPWLQSHPTFFLEAFSGSFRVGPQLPFEVEQPFVIVRIIVQVTRGVMKYATSLGNLVGNTCMPVCNKARYCFTSTFLLSSTESGW